MMEAVEALVRRHNLFHPRTVIVVGVSGGPDSMALLDYCIKKKEEMEWTVIVAHVDHMFRGKESKDDAHFVQGYCEKLGIGMEMVRKNVPLHIEKTGESPQSAARTLRYQFFDDIMQQYKAEYLALAHHGDDQIETMLMNMVRGTSSYGLSGIPVKRPFSSGWIVRPFLGITKDEIVHHCKDESIPYRLDPSNFDLKYTRNRYRRQVLPFLKQENARVHEKFQKLSEQLTEDEQYLQTQAEQTLNEALIQKENKGITITISHLLEVAIPLQRRVINLILNYLYQSDPTNILLTHIEDCLQLIKAQNPSALLHLPSGLIVKREYRTCIFSFHPPQEVTKGYTYRLQIERTYTLPVGTLAFRSDVNGPSHKGKDCFLFSPSQVQWPLTVRNRKKGDRIRPHGMHGTRKVKDVFIDAKVPRALRDIWPVVVDASGKVLWIPGIKYAELSRHHPDSQPKMALYFEKQA